MAGEILDNQGRGDASWGWPAIHPEGRKYGVIALAITLAFWLILGWPLIHFPLLFLSLGVFAFFRDPERVVPQADNAIIAPADGLVTLIDEAGREVHRWKPPVHTGRHAAPLQPGFPFSSSARRCSSGAARS